MDDTMKMIKPGMTMIILGLILQVVGGLISKPDMQSALSGGSDIKMILGTALGSLASICFAIGVGQILIASWHSSNRGG